MNVYKAFIGRDSLAVYMDNTKDHYMRIEYCCEFPDQQLIWEQSMGYLPMIYCRKCNRTQRLEQ